MQVAFFLFILILLAAVFGGGDRWVRAAIGCAGGVVSGFLVGAVCGWADALSSEQVLPTLTGGWQALREINWPGAGFFAGIFGLAAGAGGFFLRGGPGRGVEAAGRAWVFRDLLTLWRH